MCVCGVMREGKDRAIGNSAKINELLTRVNPKQTDGAETNVHWREGQPRVPAS